MPTYTRIPADQNVEAICLVQETRVQTPFGTIVGQKGDWLVKDYQGRDEIYKYDEFVSKFDPPAGDTEAQTYLARWKPAPRIDMIEPTTGPATTSLYIEGNYFNATQGASKVFMGVVHAVEAVVTAWSPTQITATVPAGLPTAYAIEVWVVVSNKESNHASFQVTA